MSETDAAEVGVTDPMEVRNEGERLIRALDTLLACYRISRRPTDRQLDEIAAARAAWDGLGKRMGNGS